MAAGFPLVMAGCSPTPPLLPQGGSTSEGDTAASTSGGEVPASASDRCGAASLIREGTYRDTLANRTETLGGACGLGGVEAFYALRVPWRSDVRVAARGFGFDPRVGVLPRGCAGGWSASLGCGQGVDLWLTDLAVGTELAIAIGAAEEPSDADPELLDPLAFELDVRFRRILKEGEICSPAERGRCPSGTQCVSEDDDAVRRCVTVDGDTCADAIPLEPSSRPLAIAFPSSLEGDITYGDDHHHTCGGERRPDRVFRLQGEALANAQQLTIEPLVPDLLVAVRGPSCLPSDEIACVSANTLAPLVLTDPAEPMYLFVEMPRSATGGDEPIGAARPLMVISLQP